MFPDALFMMPAPTQYMAIVRKLIIDCAKGCNADMTRVAPMALSRRSSEDLSNLPVILSSPL